MKQTNSIYLYKIVFTISILLFHYPPLLEEVYSVGGKPGWYIAVEFFFMVSGYLMYANLDRYKERFKTAWGYTRYRIRSIWIKYIIAFFAIFVAVCVNSSRDIKAIIGRLLEGIPEIFMIQGIRLNRGWDYINPPLWYISVMLIAGYIIMWFLYNKKELFVGIIAPIVLLLGYGILYRECGGLDAVTKTVGIIGNTALIRGLCDMCLGIYAAMITNRLSNKVKRVWVYRAISFILVVLVLVLSIMYGYSEIDFALLGIIFFIVVFGFSSRKRGKMDVFIEKLSALTLNMYMIHELFRTYVMPDLFGMPDNVPDKIIYTLIYLVFVFVAALIMEATSFFIKKTVFKTSAKGVASEKTNR